MISEATIPTREEFQAREADLDEILCPNSSSLAKPFRESAVMRRVCELMGIGPHDWKALDVIERHDYKRAAVVKLTGADPLITRRQIAAALFIQRNSLDSSRWPEPEVPHRGRRPAQWRYSTIAPLLKSAYPNSAHLVDSLGG